MKQALLPVAEAPAKAGQPLSDLVGPYEFQEVILADCQIDDYQRAVKPHSRCIAANFCPEAAGVLMIGRRDDGTLWIVDGQQRSDAMKKRGISRWPAIIFASEGRRHESRVFNVVNSPEGRKGLSWREIWKSKKCEEDPVILRAEEMLAAHGLRLGNGHGTAGVRNHLTCYALVYRQVKWGRPEDLDEALRIVTTAWPGFGEALTHTMLAAVIRVITGFRGKVDVKRLIAVLKNVSPVKVMEEASKGLTGYMVVRVVKILLRRYNSRLHQKNHLKLDGTDTPAE